MASSKINVQSVQLESFALKLRNRKTFSSHNLVMDTVMLIKQLLGSKRFTSPENVISYLEKLEGPLKRDQRIEISITNILKRVINIAQEEKHIMSQESLDGRKEDANGASGTLAEIDTEGFLARIFQGIDELEDEFANSSANISSNSWEHIHSNELILTAGDSQTVEQFLKVASSARNFQVIVTETGSSFSGHQAALRLAEHGIDTIVISDSAVFAIMPEISKVILSSHAVTANGGVTAVSGSRIITAAANFFSTPVVFLTGLHKISPISPHNTVGFSYFRSPENVYSFSDENIDTTKILDPTFDYIPPGHVSLFITNVGIFPPSSIQQLVKDTYGI